MYRGGEEVNGQLTSIDTEWTKSLHTFTDVRLARLARIKGIKIGPMLSAEVYYSNTPKRARARETQ